MGVFLRMVSWDVTVAARTSPTASLSSVPASSWPPRPATPDKGTAWQPAAPTTRVLVLASSFRDRKVREEVRRRCPDIRGRIELDAGETAAIAERRGNVVERLVEWLE